MKKDIKEKYQNIQNDERTDAQLQQNQRRQGKKKAMIALSIATAVLGVTTTGLAIGYGVSQNNANHYKTELENVYNDNFYNLLDSVNNLENKLSKTLSATSSTYQRKTLLEASKNASEAEISISGLPLTQNDIEDTAKLVNQISGYTTTLAEKLAKGESLSQDEVETLEKVHKTVVELQKQLNQFERKLEKGYSIVESSMNVDANGNEFSSSLSSLKSAGIEYPSMIYDGPFSDSVVSSAVKGLKGEKVSKEKAKENVEKHFKNTVNVEYEGKTTGKFETFNFRATNADDEMLFVQVSQIGGNILTISGVGRDGEETIDFEAAKNIAIEFAADNGIELPEVVWSDTIGNDVYMNIAPVQKGIILYPDLVKVKINLASGTIVGYDATPYFTNHTERALTNGSITKPQAVGYVPSTYEIVGTRLVLAPLDYNREVVCMEVEADAADGTYFFYFNAASGELENVLKVIETDNGNLLM